jgi:low temperature requirement protein LtrA
MTQRKRPFREWWQLPRRASEKEISRQISFLELFYDLAYVVIIAELSHSLSTNLSWKSVGEYIFLFFIVWWAWFNGASYHDTHGNNDFRTRVFTFLQMITVVAMAVFAGDAIGEGSFGFALSYAAFQLTLTFLWWRAGVHDADHAVISNPYSFAFLVTSLLFLFSIFVDESSRFTLWGIATVISLLLPIFIFRLRKRNTAVQRQLDNIELVTPSIVERFGLFGIIVLGEVIVSVVEGLSTLEQFTPSSGLLALLGSLMAIGLWWIYFDFVSHRMPRDNRPSQFAWFYLHLPMTMGIAAVGVGLLSVVEHAGEAVSSEMRWLLVAASAIILISVALMIQVIELQKEHKSSHPAGQRMMLVSAALVFLLAYVELPAAAFLGALVLLILAPVVVGFRAWLILPDQG